MITAPSKRYTIYDLADFPDNGKLRDLVDGAIVEWDMPTYVHAFLMTALSAVLDRFVQEHRLGQVVSGDLMVRILGSEYHARGADIAFYRRGRLPRDINAPATVVAPDFVVEIISPSDRAGDVQEKINDWLKTGVQLLWYVNPQTGMTAVYHEGRVSYVEATDTLDGADLLPGFQLRLQDLLDELRDTEDEQA